MFGLVLLVGIPVEFVTGLISYAAYNPRLGQNDLNPRHADLGFYLFNWATNPSWLYRVTEGIHIMLGLAMVPVVLAKLWSVIPKLFAWPPLRSAAQLLERLSLVMLVGGVVFEMSTGILDIDYYGLFGFDFYTGHFYGAWIFIAGFVVHAVLKFPRMVRALRSRRFRTELGTSLADTRPEQAIDGLADDGLIAVDPSPPTISRRGVLALVGATSLAVFLMTAGETIGSGLRKFALLGTHYRSAGVGANDFQVNHTAVSSGITAAAVGPEWVIELVGARRVQLSRAELLDLRQRTAVLPIACTEGWSTVQRWTGVPLADLARMAGASSSATATLESIDPGLMITLASSQVQAADSMLALKVNGAVLSIDHGFPARVIVPAAPGVYCRKWMKRITFVEAD